MTIADQLATSVRHARRDQLDVLTRGIWSAHAEGHLTDGEAQRLAEAADRRRGRAGCVRTPAGITHHEATPAQIEAQLQGVDRERIRRRSYDMEAPTCRIDRNQANWIRLRARLIERKTYATRAKGKHHGALGDLGLDLLDLLMNVAKKYGRIFQCYATLAKLLRKDKESVINAMVRLIDAGFVTKHRRSKKITTPQGARRVQDSNAYEVHLPNRQDGNRPQSSESDKPAVSLVRPQPEQNSITLTTQTDRWWIPKPYFVPDLGWI